MVDPDLFSNTKKYLMSTMLFYFNSHQISDVKIIEEETSVLGSIIKRLKDSKHSCLYSRLEYLVCFPFI